MWSEVKKKVCKFNVAPTLSSSVAELINTQINSISDQSWTNCVNRNKS